MIKKAFKIFRNSLIFKANIRYKLKDYSRENFRVFCILHLITQNQPKVLFFK